MDSRDIQSHMMDWYKFDEKNMVLIFEDDDENEVHLPAVFEVCGLCGGKGSHVNPSIDSHGITSDEWERDWDDEDRESYRNGAYDVSCHRCGGARVEPIPSPNAHPDLLKVWNDRAESEYESAYNEVREREMGY
jgi:hypothetical protein